VFGPFERFPLADPRPYTPPLADRESYLLMLAANGFSRGVLVHGGAHGWDLGAMLDAISVAPDRLRGVAVVPSKTSDADLQSLHVSGVRGLRFTEVAGPSAGRSFAGRVGIADLYVMAPRLRELGWHAQIWANNDVIADNEVPLRSMGVPLVVDHMGYFDVTRGVADAAFQALLRLVADGIAWVKLTAVRNSKTAPGCEDVRAFHDALIAANPERLIWGSDWPFLGLTGDRRPDTGRLLDTLLEWLGDDGLRNQVLVSNPASLYGFA
jgi:predicted TIM-barrel fold metal-dependent hydrolase